MNVTGVQVKETTNFFLLFLRLNGIFPPSLPCEGAERADMVTVTVPGWKHAQRRQSELPGSVPLCVALQVVSGEGSGTPLQYSCLENPMGGGAWWAAVHGVTKSRTRLSNFTFTFHFHALEKEMATHSNVLEPGESQGWGSLVGCRLWGCTESDTTEVT